MNTWSKFHPKVSASAVAGALAVVILAELNRHGITLDSEETSAITFLLTVLAAYLVPSNDLLTEAKPNA